MASVGAVLVAGVGLVLVIVAETIWSGLGSLWRGFLLTGVTGGTTAVAFLFLRSRLAIVELFSAIRRGVARAEQLCEAATEEENAADGVVLAEPAIAVDPQIMTRMRAGASSQPLELYSTIHS